MDAPSYDLLLHGARREELVDLDLLLLRESTHPADGLPRCRSYVRRHLVARELPCVVGSGRAVRVQYHDVARHLQVHARGVALRRHEQDARLARLATCLQRAHRLAERATERQVRHARGLQRRTGTRYWMWAAHCAKTKTISSLPESRMARSMPTSTRVRDDAPGSSHSDGSCRAPPRSYGRSRGSVAARCPSWPALEIR